MDALAKALAPDSLDGLEENNFQRWYGSLAPTLGINPNPDDPRQFYDYRKAFQSGVPGPNWDSAVIYGRPHWDSRYKMAGHPNLIVNGIDTRTGQRVK